MKKLRYFIGLFMFAPLMFITNSCSDDIPTYYEEVVVGCNNVEITNIKVLVCDATQTNYYGRADVFMYKTEADRTNDPQRDQAYQKAATDAADPTTKGALFYKTPYQTWYFYVRFDLGGGNFLTGVGQTTPIMCNTRELIVVIS